MANLRVTEVRGFDELNRKLRTLTDRMKRTEVLKLMRRLARPVVPAYRSRLPEDEGTLRRSVAIKTVPSRESGGNPAIAVRPGKSGRNDAFYKFMVIPKGTKLSGRGKGSRKGKNNVVPIARDRTLGAMESGLVQQAEDKSAKFVQKQIDRLSRR
nr:HK97 gp10 family phage protein [Allomuricauda sp.]